MNNNEKNLNLNFNVCIIIGNYHLSVCVKIIITRQPPYISICRHD